MTKRVVSVRKPIVRKYTKEECSHSPVAILCFARIGKEFYFECRDCGQKWVQELTTYWEPRPRD